MASPTARMDVRLALLSLVLSLIPACVTQFAAFWVASRVLRRTRTPHSPPTMPVAMPPPAQPAAAPAPAISPAAAMIEPPEAPGAATADPSMPPEQAMAAPERPAPPAAVTSESTPAPETTLSSAPAVAGPEPAVAPAAAAPPPAEPRTETETDALEGRTLAIAAQTCAVFMIPVTGVVAVALAVLVVPWIQRRQAQVQEVAVLEALWGVRDAQSAWREKDADGDGKREFCTDSVAALHDTPGPDGRPVALVPRAVALADPGAAPRGTTARAYRGYFFRALRADHEGTPYRNRAAHGYGLCAWPELPSYGRKMYLLNEEGLIWAKDYSFGVEPSEWPARDPATKGWQAVR